MSDFIAYGAISKFFAEWGKGQCTMSADTVADNIENFMQDNLGEESADILVLLTDKTLE